MTKLYQGYLIDLDGTVYQGKTKIPAAKRFIEKLQQQKIPFIFVTNNTTRTPAMVVENLAKNHDIHVTEANVYTAGQAATDFLINDANEHAQVKTAYVIGENGLKGLIANAGFDLYQSKPNYVVVGLDQDVTYHKLAQAVLLVLQGAKFIGTNADALIPSEFGMLPSAGSLIALIEYATKVKPTMIGKPNALIVDNARKRLGLPKEDVVMVGDNYDTDILAGINAGVDTLLVYTGVSTPAQVSTKQIQPTYTVNNFDEWQI